MIKVKVQKVRGDAEKPEKATSGSSGFDLCASVVFSRHNRAIIGDLPVILKPGESVLLGTGVRFEIPADAEGYIIERSGLKIEYDIDCPCFVIDSDFRGEPVVLLTNSSKEDFPVFKNMRIAQIIFRKKEKVVLIEAESLSKTERGEKGIGSTGLSKIKKKIN